MAILSSETHMYNIIRVMPTLNAENCTDFLRHRQRSHCFHEKLARRPKRKERRRRVGQHQRLPKEVLHHKISRQLLVVTAAGKKRVQLPRTKSQLQQQLRLRPKALQRQRRRLLEAAAAASKRMVVPLEAAAAVIYQRDVLTFRQKRKWLTRVLPPQTCSSQPSGPKRTALTARKK